VRGRTALVLIPAIAFALAVRSSQASPSAPGAVTLQGDADLVAAVKATLASRGIPAAADAPGAVPVKLERRAGRIVVSVETPGGSLPREVTDPRTAATIIESLVRTDVEAPLLAERAIDPTPAPFSSSSPSSSSALFDDPVTPPPVPVPTAAVSVEAPRAGRGVQLFTLAETSRANDHTSWLGVSVGACLMLGPVCAGARARFAVVVDQPWQMNIDRHGVETLLGADLPLRLGSLTLAPGFGIGLGSMHSHVEGAGRSEETGGPHADLHVALSYPLGRRTALEAALSLDVTQTTHVETSSPVALPDEPRAFGRLGVGLRFGAL